MTHAQRLLRRERANICGVYYLWDGAEVLYIGSSRNVRQRIAHWRSARLDFAGYFIDEYPQDTEQADLLALEAAAILEFRPKYNEYNA